MDTVIKKNHTRYFHVFHLLSAFKNVRGKVLDVGCGKGAILANLKTQRQDLQITGCDFDIKSLQAFKKQFGSLYAGEDISLVRVPKGYEADNPAADYLKLKSFIATRSLTDEEITSRSLQKTCISAFTALRPLLEFINRAK